MGFNARLNSITHGSVNQSAQDEQLTFNRSVYWGEGCTTDATSKQYVDVASPPTVEDASNSFSINNNQTKYNNHTDGYPCDTVIYGRAYGYFEKCLSGQEEAYSTIKSIQTYAIEPDTVPVPVLDNESTSSIRANASGVTITVNTVISECDVILQYQENGAGSWTDWGTQAGTDLTGYTSSSLDTLTVTGLSAGTQYNFRYKLDRSETTNGTTVYYSSESSTSTLAADPTVTTTAATGVNAGVSGVPNDGQATLNATVDLNDQYPSGDCEKRFVWDTTPTGGTYSGSTSWLAVSTVTEVVNVSAVATGLTESTEYGFRCEIRWNSGTETANGSELTFTVPADPGAAAISESHCSRKEETAKRNQAATFKFHLPSLVATSTDLYETAASPFGSTSVYLFKDGAYDSDLTNSVLSQVSASKQLYSISLTADNLDCNFADIIITDAGTAHGDVHIKIWTEINLGNVDIDASQMTNTTALKLTGGGTSGHALEAVGGASGDDIRAIAGNHSMLFGTIASSADSTHVTLGSEGDGSNDDIYNGSVILFYFGGGAGQFRVIEDYDSGTKACTLNQALNNYVSDPVGNTTKYVVLDLEDMWLHGPNPGAELSAMPVYTDYFSAMLQYIFERVAYKHIETATVHKILEAADDTTPKIQYAVDFDGSKETKNRAGDV